MILVPTVHWINKENMTSSQRWAGGGSTGPGKEKGIRMGSRLSDGVTLRTAGEVLDQTQTRRVGWRNFPHQKQQPQTYCYVDDVEDKRLQASQSCETGC